VSSEAAKRRIQECPNCQARHDVGVYVNGQKLRCQCGIAFEVRRTDVSVIGVSLSNPQHGFEPTLTPRPPAGEGAGPPLHGVGSAPAYGAPQAVPSEGAPPSPIPLTEEANETPGGTFIRKGPVAPELPGYELIEVLGRGGMGEVWRAHQISLQRMVAIKLLPPKLAKDREFVTRFEKEATALASLNHPHIIQIIDRGAVGENYYFAMEYVQGRSLREVIATERLEPAQALKIIGQICDAIDYAHEKQIIHRDLKPENILIDERGHVKVADFGLAGIRGSDQKLNLTATSVAMGTINYMAPEQRRDAKNVDGRADLYSLGVMLYELLTGELPLGRFKLPSERVKGLDARLDEIVTRSLETDPQSRYQRASAIGAALQGVMATTSEVNTVPGRKPASEKGSGNKLKIGLALVAGLALLGFAAQYFGGEPSGRVGLLDTYPPNTHGELFAASSLADGELALSFDPGFEEINAHAGNWKLEGGKLVVQQAGSELPPGTLKLVPRAYVAKRYYASDDFTAEVQMQLQALPEGITVESEAQQFGELSFRIKNLQVSLFAIPEAGMRMGWHYFTPGGSEQVGNSSRDIADMVEDEVPVPRGPFKLRLTLRKKGKDSVEAEAFVDQVRIARKLLPGLVGQTGKVALGCRNLWCTFDDLKVNGKVVDRPPR
jgi:hypothetical protein